MNVALLCLAIPICIADVHSLVIPNIYNKILFYIALVHVAVYGLGRLQDDLISIAVLLFLLLFGTGMGDIKLLALILLTHPYRAIDFIGSILLVAVVHIVVLIGIHRRIPFKLPLAPSIFMGFVTYLATR
jgi:Flp pilus assembly protein protease CpaA